MVGPHTFIQIRVTSAKGGATGSVKKTKSIGESENFHSLELLVKFYLG